MLTLSFLCSHMCLLWKWISSQFGWTHDNDTITLITTWAFLFYLTSIMLSSCSVHQLYTFFKIFCHTNYCQKVFSTTFVEIKSASYPFLRMDVRLFLCFNPVLGKICISIRFGQQMDEENALYLWAILWHTRGSYFVPDLDFVTQYWGCWPSYWDLLHCFKTKDISFSANSVIDQVCLCLFDA